MNKKKIVGIILQIPLYLLVLASFIASIYAAVNHISGITYSTPVILGLIIAAFVGGSFLKREKSESGFVE